MPHFSSLLPTYVIVVSKVQLMALTKLGFGIQYYIQSQSILTGRTSQQIQPEGVSSTLIIVKIAKIYICKVESFPILVG